MTASVESSGGRRQVTVGSTCGQSLDSRVLGCRLREPFTAFQAFVDSTDLTGQEQTRPLRPVDLLWDAHGLRAEYKTAGVLPKPSQREPSWDTVVG